MISVNNVIGIRKQRTPSEWFGYVVAQAIQMAVRTWAVMLLVGWIHHDLVSAVPALGFWQVAGVLILLDFILESAIASGVKVAIREELR